jgi:hypothetical protein
VQRLLLHLLQVQQLLLHPLLIALPLLLLLLHLKLETLASISLPMAQQLLGVQ